MRITEMIPDHMPAWMIEAMAEGQLLSKVVAEFDKLETQEQLIRRVIREEIQLAFPERYAAKR